MTKKVSSKKIELKIGVSSKKKIELKTLAIFKCTVPLNRDKYQLSFLRNGLLITSNPGALTVARLTRCRLHKADGNGFPIPFQWDYP